MPKTKASKTTETAAVKELEKLRAFLQGVSYEFHMGRNITNPVTAAVRFVCDYLEFAYAGEPDGDREFMQRLASVQGRFNRIVVGAGIDPKEL